jgi:hypothetical protein
MDYQTGDDGANAGTAFIHWSWPAITARRGDNTTLTIAANTARPVPGTPSLSQVAGGALGARTRYVRTAFVKDGLLAGISAESNLAVSANNLLKVTSPAANTNYDGWVPLVGSAANGNMEQALLATPVAFGTDWTEPSGGATVSGKTPYSAYSAFGATGIVAVDKTESTQYHFYPYYDALLGMVRMFNGIRTAKSDTDRIGQFSLLRYRMSEGAMSVTTPAVAGTGGGSDGGGQDGGLLVY